MSHLQVKLLMDKGCAETYKRLPALDQEIEIDDGRDFDLDCPWATEILRAGAGPPAERIEQLVARAAAEA